VNQLRGGRGKVGAQEERLANFDKPREELAHNKPPRRICMGVRRGLGDKLFGDALAEGRRYGGDGPG